MKRIHLFFLFVVILYTTPATGQTQSSGVITTIAGAGTNGYSGDGGSAITAKFYDPTHVAVDSAGNLYIADPYASRVRKVTPSGIITAVAGAPIDAACNCGAYGFSGDGGAATSAKLYYPSGIAVDAAGKCYIPDKLDSPIPKG